MSLSLYYVVYVSLTYERNTEEENNGYVVFKENTHGSAVKQCWILEQSLRAIGTPGYIGWRNRFLAIDSWSP